MNELGVIYGSNNLLCTSDFKLIELFINFFDKSKE